MNSSRRPESHEIPIKIAHCSVVRGDVGFLRNDCQISDLTYPLIAGHEIVGTVEAVGGFAIGDRVGVGRQVSCCGECSIRGSYIGSSAESREQL